ncbi:hypothetical protein ABZ570_07160 [Micromonospora sp. NPDC007271]|uniref:hypothetical protein n=1 Tax=Micromonospora sp. NPDC007271 TaxID=3154587 RepID=UPI0033FA14DF
MLEVLAAGVLLDEPLLEPDEPLVEVDEPLLDPFDELDELDELDDDSDVAGLPEVLVVLSDPEERESVR